VLQLVEHHMRERVGYKLVLEGSSFAEAAVRASALSLTPDTAVSTTRDTSQRLCAAFAEPGALDRSVDYPTTEWHGLELLQASLFETCVHTWDLAKALGLDERLNDELMALAYDAAVPIVAHFRTTTYTFFGPAPTAALPPDASAQTRLLHLTGRATN
jgi:uncharacterized protein (TIGR03086 family)